MYYTQPTYQKEKVIGFEEGYKFKHVQSIQLTVETNVGGWENQEPSKNDGYLLVKKGTGTARMQGRSYVLEADTLLEIPQGVLVEMGYSQLKYYAAKATKGGRIQLSQATQSGTWTPLPTTETDRVLVIKNGFGFAKIGNKTYRLDENGVLEVPANTPVQLSGEFAYVLIEGSAA